MKDRIVVRMKIVVIVNLSVKFFDWNVVLIRLCFVLGRVLIFIRCGFLDGD